MSQRGAAATETRMGMSRAKLAKHVLSKVEGSAQFPQIPLFPPLSKVDEGDCWIALRQTHQTGGMKISSQLANNFDYCSTELGTMEL
jgi:hypothetical protein